MMLGGTNWRVAAINGRPVPPQNFYMNFMPDNQIGAVWLQLHQRELQPAGHDADNRPCDDDPHGVPGYEL
jgi:hypothetical protein